MAKASNNAKKRKAAASSSNAQNKKLKATAIATTDGGGKEDAEMLGGLIYPDEMETTVDVLQMLAKEPALLKSKGLRAFKTAMWDTWRAMNEVSGAGSSLTSKISATLQSSLHLESLILLSELRLRGQTPKLGSLQRWVRECDAAAIAASEDGHGKKKSTEELEKEEGMVWQVLDAILRACTGVSGLEEVAGGEVERDVRRGEKGVRRWKEWDVRRKESGDTTANSKRNLWKEVEEGTLVSETRKSIYTSSVVPLDTTPGPSRRPPNLFPAIVYHTTTPSTLALTASPSIPAPERHPVPGVPGAILITDVLTPEECLDIVSMSESVGMIEDKPVGGTAAELNSVLAHNLILLAPPQLIDPLFARVAHLLPSHVPVPEGSKASGALKGINRRFRIYRYREGSVYRPHVDGAWPSSAEIPASADGLVPAKYVYDSDPTLYSRFTFLLYLNDSFSSGQTTFFIPDPNRDGVLDARPVRPLQGAALVFPHGATEGSLLHEGSPVFPSEYEGAKYVIRTEVLYEVERMQSAGEGGVVGGLV